MFKKDGKGKVPKTAQQVKKGKKRRRSFGVCVRVRLWEALQRQR